MKQHHRILRRAIAVAGGVLISACSDDSVTARQSTKTEIEGPPETTIRPDSPSVFGNLQIWADRRIDDADMHFTFSGHVRILMGDSYLIDAIHDPESSVTIDTQKNSISGISGDFQRSTILGLAP
ncbi:hypothetical protein [Haloferula sp.]|uniref:hypothetical protein n=1 Tax=Haloferula sp. TaxID=2497595 RepID=UPI003C785941